MKQKLVSLLFALAFAQYAPAQGATSVDLVGVGGAFALPIYTAPASTAKSIRGEDFRVSLTNASGQSYYPVASFMWFFVPKNGVVPAKSAALQSFLRWMWTDGQGFAESLGHARLPEALRREELAIVGRL